MKRFTEDVRHQMALAAEALLLDYETDKELTAFTALDSEDFMIRGEVQIPQASSRCLPGAFHSTRES